MSSTDRHFKYKTDASAMKLLGVLMIILGPVAAVMSFQPDANQSVLVFGIEFTGPSVPWIIRLVAIVLVVAGVGMLRAPTKDPNAHTGVTLTETGVMILGTPEILYTDISQISMEPYEFHPMLCLTHSGGKIGIARSRMKKQAFDELCALIKERTGITAP